MEYYGNNDWRDYLRRQNELAHFGIPKRSGRYPWGSGENPYHHGASAPGGYKKKKQKELRDFTTADNRRVGRATMQYGGLVGLATIRDIQKGRQDTQYSKYTEPELDRIASSRNSLKGYLLGGTIAGKLEEKKIDRDKKLLGDKYKQFSEYTDEQIKRMDEAHGKPYGEEHREWYRVMKENAKAINAARKEAKSEQKIATKENQDNFTGKQHDASNIVDKYHNNVESLSEADYKKLRDTSKEIRNKGERATNAESALEKQANTILENRIANEVKRAKEKDNYDFNFLEAIQNKQIIKNGHEAERLKAYEEYLRDPEGFWDKLDKYKDM